MGFASPFRENQCCCKRNDAKFQLDICAGCSRHSRGGEDWACRRHRESAKNKRIPLPAGGLETADLKYVTSIVSEVFDIPRVRISIRSTGGVRFEVVMLDSTGEVADVFAEFLGKRELFAWIDGMRVAMKQVEERRRHAYEGKSGFERNALSFEDLLMANRSQKRQTDSLIEVLSGKKQVK